MTDMVAFFHDEGFSKLLQELQRRNPARVNAGRGHQAGHALKQGTIQRKTRLPHSMPWVDFAPPLSPKSERATHAFPGVREVTAEHFGERLPVAGFQCNDHLFVLGHGCGPFFRPLMSNEADALQAHLQHRMDLGE